MGQYVSDNGGMGLLNGKNILNFKYHL